MNTTRPYTVKGVGYTSPKGKALWCKPTVPERKFNQKGDLMTSLVCDPNDPDVKAFITLLEDLRDQAFEETKESLGAVKAKAIKARPVFAEDSDKDGNATGNIVFKMKLGNIDDRKETGRQSEIVVVDAKKAKIENVPAVGNGSVIRVAGFANPYYMASTKEVGVSLIWAKLQIISLEAFEGHDDFGEEEGFEVDSVPAVTAGVDISEVPF